MKKLLTLLFFSFFAMFSYAQLFTKIAQYDKFDDVIKEEERKTLVTKTDTTFVIEEKGREPVVYYILNISEAGTEGSKDDIVNLVGDVYGYQTAWCLVRYDLLDRYREAQLNYLIQESDSSMKKLSSFWVFAIHRTITTQYTGRYLTEYFWLQDELNDGKLGQGVNRIIYKKD